MNIFCYRLIKLRKQKGLSQAELANMVEVDQKTISNWESGKQEPYLRTCVDEFEKSR